MMKKMTKENLHFRRTSTYFLFINVISVSPYPFLRLRRRCLLLHASLVRFGAAWLITTMLLTRLCTRSLAFF